VLLSTDFGVTLQAGPSTNWLHWFFHLETRPSFPVALLRYPMLSRENTKPLLFLDSWRLLSSPCHHLFTKESTPTPILLTYHLHLRCIVFSALALLVLLPYTIVTLSYPRIQTLFFLTRINTPHMYQYSSSLILKLFLSHSLLSHLVSLILLTHLDSNPSPKLASC